MNSNQPTAPVAAESHERFVCAWQPLEKEPHDCPSHADCPSDADCPGEAETIFEERTLDPPHSVSLPIGRVCCDSFPHPVYKMRTIETHLSTVILTGMRAYKIKKPALFDFVDASDPTKRAAMCRRELEVNRQYAGDIYLDVVPITRAGRDRKLRFGGDGTPVEYAVAMRQFDDRALVASRVDQGLFTCSDAKLLGETIARWHDELSNEEPVEIEPHTWTESVLEDFLAVSRLVVELLPADDATDADSLQKLEQLDGWVTDEHERIAFRLSERAENGAVRDCHGDLHLENLLQFGSQVRAFDAIEFDDRLRRVDTASEIAFPVMDLFAHGRDDLAWTTLNAYLQATGDYDGLGVMRLFLVYRAMVRCMAHLLRDGDTAVKRARVYLQTALRLAEGFEPSLTITHGVSGSGKTTQARRFAAQHGAIVVRSDVQRQHLELAGQYDATSRSRVYEDLQWIAADALDDGWPVLVDATFLDRERRDHFRQVAKERDVVFAILDCEIDPDVAATRVLARQRGGGDASEAGVKVLERQLQFREPLDADEQEEIIGEEPRVTAAD